MKQIDKSLEKVLFELFDSRKFSALSDVLLSMNPADAGLFLNMIPEESLAGVFARIPVANAGLLFVELDDQVRPVLIKGMDDPQLSSLLGSLYMDDVISLVRLLDDTQQQRVKMLLEPDRASELAMMLAYKPDSIGSLMNTSFIVLNPEMSIKDAVAYIRVAGLGKETVNVCYVTDSSRRLVGSLGLRSLVTARDDKMPVGTVMDSQPVSVDVNDDKEKVSNDFGKYDLTVMPVTDSQKRLCGIVTVDDVLDVVQNEATEDMQKMAAIIPSETPYLKTSVWKIWKARIPWLLVLMIGATFTAKVITAFESALSACVILTAFIPMLMDTAGNAGSQASVTVVRSLALGDLKFQDLFKVLWKEMRVAVLCGVSLVVCNFAKLLLIDKVSVTVGLTVCAALFVAVIISKLIGSALPLLLGKIGLDPAVMAGPVLTTMVDALTLVIYFTIATKILGLA